MTCYQFRLVNVFAESTFGGNPLCVFENATGMDDVTMLALARQFNLSETTFVLPSDHADARVRVFTPAGEMRFAGHPTLGTAHVVRDLLNSKTTLQLEFPAGVVPVVAHGNHWTLTAPTSDELFTKPVDVSADVIVRMIGLTEDDLLDAPRWVDTGSEQLLIPLKSVAAVQRAAPANAFLTQWPVNNAGRKTAYMFAFDGAASSRDKVCARYFFGMPNSGIAEDPGTGSACANLGGWLIATGRSLPMSVQIDQGEAVERHCRLLLDVTADRAIRVGGRVIELGRGSVDI